MYFNNKSITIKKNAYLWHVQKSKYGIFLNYLLNSADIEPYMYPAMPGYMIILELFTK